MSDFDPRDLIEKEIGLMMPFLKVQFKKFKLVPAKVPFDLTSSIQLVPMEAYAIEELSYLRNEAILAPSASERILEVLRIGLLMSMKPQLPRRIQKLVDRYLKAVLNFDFLIKEFLFLRQFITSNDVVSNILKRYYEERNDALFRKLEEERA